MPRGDEPLSIPPPETGPGKLCCHNAFGIAMGKKVTKLNITITASSASRNGPGCLGRWRLFGLVPKLRMVRRKRLLRACDVRSGQRATFDTVCCPVYRTVYRNRGGKKNKRWMVSQERVRGGRYRPHSVRPQAERCQRPDVITDSCAPMCLFVFFF